MASVARGMPWQPLPRIAFAICTYPFQPSSPADLPLEIGDELYIIEQGGLDGSWYRGYLVAPPSLLAGLTNVKGQTLEARVFSGIFPRACVEIREIFGDDRAHGKSYDYNEDSQPKSRDNGTGHRAVDSTDDLADSQPGEENSSADTTDRRLNSGSDGKHSAATQDVVGSSRVFDETGSRGERGLHEDARSPPVSKPPAPVPMLKIGDEGPTSTSEPLVDEIASCLREWHSTNLHELLLARHYKTLDEIARLVQRLDTSRKQLLYKVLTARELSTLREATVWDLVNGNKLLNGDIIVRSPTERGRILTAEDSAIEMTKLQIMMSVLNERPVLQVDTNTLHHLSMEIRGGILAQGQQITASAYLCIKPHDEPPRPLSEIHAAELQTNDKRGSVRANLRTLFVDMSSADVGESSSNPAPIYLVLRLTGYEPIRQVHEEREGKFIQRSNSSTQSTASNSYATASTNGKGGRRSMLWGQKNRNNSVSSRSNTSRPVIPEESSTVPVDARPETGNQTKSTAKDQKLVKRIVGIGVLRVDDLLRSLRESEEEVPIWQSIPASEGNKDTGKNWDSILTEILPSSSGKYRVLGSRSSLRVYLKPFTNPDADSLIKQTPTVLHKISKTRKIGFSGAPTKPRSDIYFTLQAPVVPQDAPLAHPKLGTVSMGGNPGLENLQLTLEIRSASGERMENCIFPSDNSLGHTAWRSPAVSRGESWNITIRLAIRPEDVPGSHIVMSLADAPGFPFALCWMPLWVQDAFVRDGEHPLIMYKYDEYTSSVVSGRGAYLDLPWRVRSANNSGNALVAFVRIRTYLCSTKYSQDPNLLGLLDRRKQSSPELLEILKRFSFVPEIEIVKLLHETFDAIFRIIVDHAINEEYEDLLLQSLVIVLGIVHDRRFNLGPLVDRYAEEKFSYPSAATCLTRSFNRLLADPTEPDYSKRLRATLKVGRHVFSFIASGGDVYTNQDVASKTSTSTMGITGEVRSIFKSFEHLMQNPAPILIGTKTLLVQNFYLWLPELFKIMTTEEIVEIICRFINSCAAVQGNLILYKIVLILNLCKSEIFDEPSIRRRLLKETVHWLDPYWGKADGNNGQWRNQIRLCCSVISVQLNALGPDASIYLPKLVDSYRTLQASKRNTKKTLSLSFPASFPFPTRPTSTNAIFDEALIELGAILAEVSNLSITLSMPQEESALAEILLEILEVFKSLLNCEAFPSSWLSLHIYYHRAAIAVLSKVSNLLIGSFLPHPDDSDDFNTDLWRAFFDTLLMIAGSDALALETFPEQRRRAVWKIGGDVREQAAELLKRTWQAIGWETGPEDRVNFGLVKMGGFQVQYIPDLVGPIVELCLSVHEGLRSVAIGVLQTMIIGEWSLSQDISIFQAEMIDCLDRLFMLKQPKTETILQKLFVSELLALFHNNSQNDDNSLFEAVKELMTIVHNLLDLLVAVHCNEGGGQALQISETLRLMEFLRDVQKEDIYIRYVHQLARMQASAQNSTEAGLALRLHADLYNWDPMSTLDALVDPKLASASAFERKEHLYFEMINYHEEDLSWDHALTLYAELAEQYEHNVFDFAKLARCHRAMAKIYENIGKGDTHNIRYFEVVYKGLGFPNGLREKQFIFQGAPSDRLTSFTDKLQQQHPAARLILSGNESDLEGQFLQVTPVSVRRNFLHPIFQRPKIGQSVRDFNLLARPNQFIMNARSYENEADQKQTSVEKVVLTTAEPFPTILKRSEIIRTEVFIQAPVEFALERTVRKTAELASMEKRAANGEDTAIATLIAAVTVSVDADSEASVSRYRSLLSELESDESDGDEMGSSKREPMDPIVNALKIALMDHALMIKRCLSVLSRPAYQATKMDIQQRMHSSRAYHWVQAKIYIGFELTFASELSATQRHNADPTETTTHYASGPINPAAAITFTQHQPNGRNSPAQSSSRLGSLDHDDRGTDARFALHYSHDGRSNIEDGKDERKRQLSHARSGSTTVNHQLEVESEPNTLPSISGSNSTEPLIRKKSQDVRHKPSRSDSQGVGERMANVGRRLSLLTASKKVGKHPTSSRIGTTLAEE